MTLHKRDFLLGLGATGAGLTAALAQGYPKGKDLGAVAPEKVAESQRSGTPLPSLHSSKFAPVPEPTIKTGVLTMTAAALEILGKK